MTVADWLPKSGAPRWRTIGLCAAATAVACAATLIAVVSASASAAAPSVAVFPVPGSRFGTPGTQITFRGVPASELGAISVTGSRTGPHAGRIEADSDGEGGSFLPRSPFAVGETVTVTTALNVLGGHDGSFRFRIATPGGHIAPPGKRTTVRHARDAVEHFRSRPDLRPAAVRIVQSGPDLASGDIFLTPENGPLQYGPMIVDPAGGLVWFQPLPAKQEATNLQEQSYRGQAVLTWWQGWMNAGIGEGVDLIYDQHYRQIAAVHAGNGLTADHHEFTITRQGTALIADTRLVRWNASSIGGSKDQGVLDDVVQEIDIPTGLVLFQWDSLDHVPLSATYSRVPKAHHPLDYFHVNSIQEAADGNLIISARNTWAVYELDRRTGRVIWTLGGKRSSFKMGAGTQTAYQHDAELYRGGLMSLFDNGAAPAKHTQSRGLIEQLDARRMSVRVVHELDHRPQLLSSYEGSVQRLASGRWFLGWGQQPYFTEYSATGRQIFDGRFVAHIVSYRAYRFVWSAQPITPPALAVRRAGKRAVTVYASWNGATAVARWEVLAGSSPSALTPIAGAARRGFETAVTTRTSASYFAVQAVAGDGQVLGTSEVRRR